MKLYYSPGACSLSPHIVLRESGLTFELLRVDLKIKKTTLGGDFSVVNPIGNVPALQLDDGQVLTEGPAIVQYIGDKVPEKNLVPLAGSMERYRLLEILNFIASELHKNFGAWGWNALDNPAVPEHWKLASKEMLAKRLSRAAALLEGKSFLLGDNFSVADAYLYTVLNWTKHFKIDLSPWPVFAPYQSTISARPTVQAALKAEGLIG